MKKITLLLVAFAATFTMNAQMDCANAQVVSVTAGSSTTITSANVNGTPPQSVCNNFGYTAANISAGTWYSYTNNGTDDLIATVTGPVVTSGTSTNEYFSTWNVYTGSCGSLVCLGGNGVQQLNTAPTYEFIAEAGVTYYIVFDNAFFNQSTPQGNTGPFDFSVSTQSFMCADTTIPFTEDGSSQFLGCYIAIDNDANGTKWIQEVFDIDNDGTDDTFYTNGSNNSVQKDDYLISPAITLEAGKTYNFTSTVMGFDSQTITANESLDIIISTGTTVADANSGNVIFSQTNITSGNTIAVNESFTVASTGDYHVVFKSYAVNPAAFLIVMDYMIDETASTSNVSSIDFDYFLNESNLNVTSKSIINNISVFNLLGQNVATQTINNTNGQVNIANLQNGVYVGQVTIEGQTKSFKFVKK